MRLEACSPFHALPATVPRLRTKLAIRASISKFSSFQSLNWGSWNLASQFFELIFRTCALSLLNSDKGYGSETHGAPLACKCRPSPEQTNGPDNHDSAWSFANNFRSYSRIGTQFQSGSRCLRT